jgi:regulator of protease activity HflC (stomatin/prohibitin superfamily)
VVRATKLIVKDTHRGLRFRNGALVDVLGAGRYKVRPARWWAPQRPVDEIVLVDVRQRELTLKGQEILTADKVAVRVSILVQFQVNDAAAAVTVVADYEDRIYSDVQLAARRSLAAMTLEEILTNRTRLSGEILADVQAAAQSYGVAIQRADVKDLVFPGNLQEVMNRVLAAERLAEAQLVEARTAAEKARIEAAQRAEAQRLQADAAAAAKRVSSEADALARIRRAEADADALRRLAGAASAFTEHPALLRLRELDALANLAVSDGARVYVGFDKHALPQPGE